MKLSQKKNCEGCKAYKGIGLGRVTCELKYKTEKEILNVAGYSMERVVRILEPCPKPKNYKDFFYAMEHYKK